MTALRPAMILAHKPKPKPEGFGWNLILGPSKSRCETSGLAFRLASPVLAAHFSSFWAPRCMLTLTPNPFIRASAGDWVHMGTERTDDDGRISYPIRAQNRLPPGVYPVVCCVKVGGLGSKFCLNWPLWGL